MIPDPYDYADSAAGWKSYCEDCDRANSRRRGHEQCAPDGNRLCPCDGTPEDPCTCGYVHYCAERNAAGAEGRMMPSFGEWRKANGYDRTEDEMLLAVLLDEREALKADVGTDQSRLRENRKQIAALRAKMAPTDHAPANTRPYQSYVECGATGGNDFVHDAFSEVVSDISQRIAERVALAGASMNDECQCTRLGLAPLPEHSTQRCPDCEAAKPRPRFYDHLERMRAIHDSKNADYADSATDPFRNFRQSDNVGVSPHVGAFIRLGDKYMRIANLLKREQESGNGAVVTDESVEDTLIDLANYALIVLTLHEQYRAAAE